MVAQQDDTFAEYLDVLGEIQQLIHSYNPAHVIYGGDMNTDLARNTPPAHVIHGGDMNTDLARSTPHTHVIYGGGGT